MGATTPKINRFDGLTSIAHRRWSDEGTRRESLPVVMLVGAVRFEALADYRFVKVGENHRFFVLDKGERATHGSKAYWTSRVISFSVILDQVMAMPTEPSQRFGFMHRSERAIRQSFLPWVVGLWLSVHLLVVSSCGEEPLRIADAGTVSFSPLVNLAIAGLLVVTILNLLVAKVFCVSPRLRFSISLLLVSSVVGYVGFILFGTPVGRREFLMSLCILVGLIAQVKVPRSAKRQEAESVPSAEDSAHKGFVPSEGVTGSSRDREDKLRTDRLHFAMVGLAAVTMAMGAANMFALQPMIGKLLAPRLGSVPAVWTTCMLFFQMILLAGYVYVHVLTKLTDMKRQIRLHLGIVAVSLIALPLRLPELMTRNIPEDGLHALWIFMTLALTVGAPAFVLASTAPLIQAWFGRTSHRLASDPYPLYIASNAGSMLGLISYPFLIEPYLTLTSQRMIWSVSWLVYALLLGGMAALCWRMMKQSDACYESVLRSAKERSQASVSGQVCGLASKLRWIALSFIPSSLLLGATNHLTTDISAMPMLWTLPLAIYLLSWTFSFTDYGKPLHGLIRWFAPVAVLVAVFVWAADFHEQIRWMLSIHMTVLLAVCWALHRRLYETRPDVSQLTSFYISIALGGALGGIFNALVAPVVFSGFAEYPIALVASLLFLPSIPWRGTYPRFGDKLAAFWQQCILLVLVVICTAALAKYTHQSVTSKAWDLQTLSTRLGWTLEQVERWAQFAIPLIPALLLLGRPRLQALAVSTALLVGVCINLSSDILVRERSFFGVLTVRQHRFHGWAHTLVHGGIMHGEQWFTEPDDRYVARSYYHSDGPLGDVMDIQAQRKASYRTAVIGLGTGSVAAYGQPNRPITFFEIDPAVEAIARNPNYFTYVSDCLYRGCPLDVRIGDARITMAKSADTFDVIVIDAFSSDSIPLHLITHEAIEGWFRRLQSDGVIAFHISNRYIDLVPVLANAAKALDVPAYMREDLLGDKSVGRNGSSWIIFTASPETASWFEARPGWAPPTTRDSLPVWTDDFTSVLPVLRF
jgi:SAM-dependent methyltransferase